MGQLASSRPQWRSTITVSVDALAARTAASESRRPTWPKSRPWLLAMVATSTPASLRAVRADGGARKVKSLGAGVPRSVMAVSRLTTARSARRRTSATGPRAVAGSAASRDPMAPSKWTSPPKAMVTGSPVGSRVAPARGAAVVVGRAVVEVEVAAAVVAVVWAAWPGSSPPHALSNSSAARVSEATTWRRGGIGGWWAGRGTAGSRLGRSGKRRLGSHVVTPPCQGCSAAQARAVHPGRAHRVAARGPGRADDPADDVVGPRGHPGRLQEPSEATARPAQAPPLGRLYLTVPLGVGVQVGDALVAELPVDVFPGHCYLPRSLNTSE